MADFIAFVKEERNTPCRLSQATVMEDGSNKVSRHYFAVEIKLTSGDDVKSMLKKIYEQEFIEPNMRFYQCYWGNNRRCAG